MSRAEGKGLRPWEKYKIRNTTINHRLSGNNGLRRRYNHRLSGNNGLRRDDSDIISFRKPPRFTNIDYREKISLHANDIIKLRVLASN